MRVGIYLAPDAARESVRVATALSRVRILELDATAAEQFALVKAYQRRVGRPVGDLDLLIAAIAIVNRQSLITRNQRDFEAIPELTIHTY